jgi:CRISPR-associated endonuclease/helicase Cas3
MAKRKNGKTHGKTASGKPITDEMVGKLARRAEAGYDVEETIRRRPGRPAIGSAPAAVESVRLEPELQEALAKRAERDDETTSSVIRKALRRYLKVS